MRMCHFQVQNGSFVLNKIFLIQTIITTFIYLLAFFIVQNFKKILQQIQSYEDVPFLGPKQSICPKHFFFWKLLMPFSSKHYAKFLKNSSRRSGVMRVLNLWAQNGPFAGMRFFSENLLMSLVPFIHACLHAKNQSQILIY